MFDESIGIYQVQVTATNPIQKDIQADLLIKQIEHNNYLRVVDDINKDLVKDIVRPARLKSDIHDSPDVIAPAWRPNGHRKSV